MESRLAAHLPVLVRGTVIEGEARGRTIGFPTANVQLGAAGKDVPFGVYAGRLDGRAAAISVGVRPTFGDGLEPRLEAHVLDFEGDLYGREVTVELVAWVRGERAFAGVTDLVAQLESDVARVRVMVGT